MLRRTAATNAGYLLPHPRPGMRLLDCGCGSGSITAGLAAAVAPGEVVGLDLSPEQLAFARERAAGRGAVGVRFVQGSCRGYFGHPSSSGGPPVVVVQSAQDGDAYHAPRRSGPPG